MLPATLSLALSASTDPATALVLGDSNISDFRLPSCRIVGMENGRLSRLLSFARLQLRQDNSIRKVFLCLSTLDQTNRLISLSTSVKSLLSKCHCLFPNATLFVILAGLSPQLTPSEREVYHQFSCFLRDKHPSKCIVLSAPSPFSCFGNLWSDTVKSAVEDKIRSHLNSSTRGSGHNI